MENTKTEKYGVARKGELIGVLYGTEAEAQQQHAHVSQTLENLGLTPDVDVVQVTETVSYGKPRVIEHAENAPAETEPTTDGDAGDQPQS